MLRALEATRFPGRALWQLDGTKLERRAQRLKYFGMERVRELTGRRPVHQHAVARVRKPEHLARDLLDEIGIRKIWAKERDVAFEFGAHGLETLELEQQSAIALKQFVPRLEAVSAFDGVKGEIGRQT